MERVKSLVGHLSGSGLSKHQVKHPEDVVVTLAVRTPLCKARKGGLKDTRLDELMIATFKAVIAKSGIDPALVEDITCGNVLSSKSAYEVRGAALTAGFPDTTCSQTVNRFCSSGLMAVQIVANQIRAGEIKIGLAAGIESMSFTPDRGLDDMADEQAAHPVAKDCGKPMGWTSENVAGDFNISREEMDQFAAMSFQRASEAQRSGKFVDEIVPIEAFQNVGPAPKDGGKVERKKVLISQDDGIRHGTTAESLGKIRAAFPQWAPGFTTGGNASQITDGGAAVLLMRRDEAERLKQPIIAKLVAVTTAGLPPRIMGIGPSFAIPQLLKMTGVSQDEIDLFEINEAFASMFVFCVNKLGLDKEKVNVNGGAIALGHPLGCTGARQVATGLSELKRRRGKALVTSMCIGTGSSIISVTLKLTLTGMGAVSNELPAGLTSTGRSLDQRGILMTPCILSGIYVGSVLAIGRPRELRSCAARGLLLDPRFFLLRLCIVLLSVSKNMASHAKDGDGRDEQSNRRTHRRTSSMHRHRHRKTHHAADRSSHRTHSSSHTRHTSASTSRASLSHRKAQASAESAPDDGVRTATAPSVAASGAGSASVTARPTDILSTPVTPPVTADSSSSTQSSSIDVPVFGLAATSSKPSAAKIVPIAVSCVLVAALIATILLYLFKRRRQQRVVPQSPAMQSRHRPDSFLEVVNNTLNPPITPSASVLRDDDPFRQRSPGARSTTPDSFVEQHVRFARDHSDNFSTAGSSLDDTSRAQRYRPSSSRSPDVPIDPCSDSPRWQ